MNNLLDETKEIMRHYGVIADKKLGQNFLINEEIVENIILKADLTEIDLIIEIGPGLGTLTEYLAKTAGKVISIELDKRMINLLNDRFKDESNVEIIYGDILKTNLNEIIDNNKEYTNVKIIANLPYYITTPIIMKLLEEKININSIIIMVQKEVADRIVAKEDSKDYGILTISIAYYAKASTLIQVPSYNFLPEPKVNSTVVKLELSDEISSRIKNERVFFDIVKGGFSQRRKMLMNAIDSTLKSYQIEKEVFKNILYNSNIDEQIRAEDLSIEKFINIANDVYDKIEKR